MDDTTRGVGGDRDDMTGRADESTRNLDTTSSTSTGSTRGPATRGTGGTARTTRSRSTTARSTTSATTMDADLDPETERRTRQIQSEIAETREELSETIDALQEKLRPSNIVSDATSKVRTATTERVRHMAESAGESAQEMMRTTRHATSGIVEGARQNPIPALMIGVGVAWLLVDRARHQDHDGRSRATSRSRDWRRPGASSDQYWRTQRVASGSTDDFDEDVDYGYAEYGSDYAYGRDRDWNRSVTSTSGMADRASHIANQARTRLQRSTRGAQNGLQRLLRDNPLLVGAAALVAGAAVGAALPETERENQLMGETRDSMIEKAQDMARHAASTAQEVAGDAVSTLASRVTGDDTQQ